MKNFCVGRGPELHASRCWKRPRFLQSDDTDVAGGLRLNDEDQRDLPALIVSWPVAGTFPVSATALR